MSPVSPAPVPAAPQQQDPAATGPRPLRAALTQTRNAYPAMPTQRADLPRLAGSLDAIRQANVAHNLRLIHAAHAAGARLIGLGELCTAPYFALEEQPLWRELAEDAADGPSVRAFRRAAADCGIVVVAPIYERCASGRRFNTAVVIDADGAILGSFRKVHIPRGHNEQGAFFETFYYEASDGNLRHSAAVHSRSRFFPVFATAVGRVGVAICYDRHFAGSVESLAAAGAEIILCPAITFGEKSRRMWRHEFPTDAMRHRVYIGGSNRQGIEPPWDIEYFGDSYFCGPDGELTNLSRHPELVISDLDLDRLRAPDPSGWDLRRDQRPEAYAPRPGPDR